MPCQHGFPLNKACLTCGVFNFNVWRAAPTVQNANYIGRQYIIEVISESDGLHVGTEGFDKIDEEIFQDRFPKS